MPSTHWTLIVPCEQLFGTVRMHNRSTAQVHARQHNSPVYLLHADRTCLHISALYNVCIGSACSCTKLRASRSKVMAATSGEMPSSVLSAADIRKWREYVTRMDAQLLRALSSSLRYREERVAEWTVLQDASLCADDVTRAAIVDYIFSLRERLMVDAVSQFISLRERDRERTAKIEEAALVFLREYARLVEATSEDSPEGKE